MSAKAFGGEIGIWVSGPCREDCAPRESLDGAWQKERNLKRSLSASQLKLNIFHPLPEAEISTVSLPGSQAFAPWIELYHWLHVSLGNPKFTSPI